MEIERGQPPDTTLEIPPWLAPLPLMNGCASSSSSPKKNEKNTTNTTHLGWPRFDLWVVVLRPPPPPPPQRLPLPPSSSWLPQLLLPPCASARLLSLLAQLALQPARWVYVCGYVAAPVSLCLLSAFCAACFAACAVGACVHAHALHACMHHMHARSCCCLPALHFAFHRFLCSLHRECI